MYSYSTRVCHNRVFEKEKKKEKRKKEEKYNTQRHKLKFPVSMNYLVVLIFTLTALKFTTSLCIYSLPFDRLICFEKRSKLESVENRRGWAFYSEFLLYCYLSLFFFMALY